MSDEGFAHLGAREAAALALTDALIGDPNQLDAAAVTAIREHFDRGQVVEMALGVGLFLGMSKVLINLGLEPESMPVTVLPTPGSQTGS